MEKLLTGVLIAAIIAMGGGALLARTSTAAQDLAFEVGRPITGHYHCAAYDHSPDCFAPHGAILAANGR